MFDETVPQDEWQNALTIQKIKVGRTRRKLYGITDTKDIPETFERLCQDTYGCSAEEKIDEMTQLSYEYFYGENYEEAFANGQALARVYALADGIESYQCKGILDMIEKFLSLLVHSHRFFHLLCREKKNRPWWMPR